MATCQVCQKENPQGAEYCEDCGAALPQIQAAVPAAAGSSASNSAPATNASTPIPVVLGEEIPAIPAPSAGQEGVAPPEIDPSQVPAGGGTPAANPAPSAAEPGAIVPSTMGPGTGAGTATGTNPRLVAIHFGAPTGEEVPLLGERLVVGRFDAETGPVDIDLSGTPESVHISRRHGELFREGQGAWSVRDLGSTNGVFVKSSADSGFGPRITAPRPLSNGDEVSFANARFIFKTD